MRFVLLNVFVVVVVIAIVIIAVVFRAVIAIHYHFGVGAMLIVLAAPEEDPSVNVLAASLFVLPLRPPALLLARRQRWRQQQCWLRQW
jgi:hypothetical protein